jgi:3',5'-cyclic-nucleotide phosphodiesterase
VELTVLGCHGGETPKHRTSAFLLDRKLAIDAGALTSALDIPSQCAIEAVLISHAHLDHIRDLSTIADNRVQNGAQPLKVCATAETLRSLRDHFFNDQLWPDFTKIPTDRGQTIELVELASGVENVVGAYRVRPIPVTHTIDCSGFLVEDDKGSIAYSGDTAATDELWNVLNGVTNLRALLIEVSFPDDQTELALRSCHHTPSSLAFDLRKYKAPKDLPTLLYHMKPTFQAVIERECARLTGLNLTPLALGDEFVL